MHRGNSVADSAHMSDKDGASEADSKPPSDILSGIEQMVEAVLENPGCGQIVEEIVENMDTTVVVDQMAEAIKIAVLAEKILSEVSQGMVESTEPGPEDEGVEVDKDEDHVKCLADIEEGYSQAHGSKIVWDTDVNLNPPGVGKDVSKIQQQQELLTNC